MATQVLNQIAQYLATVPLQRKQQRQENEFANRRLALQEEEDKRQAAIDAINQQIAQGTLENAQFEAGQRTAGQSALEDYGRAAEIQPSINELKQGKELTKNVAPYSMDFLLAQPEATPLALTDKYKLPQYSKYNKGVESTLEQLNKNEENRIKEQKTSGAGGGANVWSQKTYKYTNDPNALPALKAQLKDFSTKGLIDTDTYDMLDRLSNTDPANAEMLFNKMITAPKLAASTISAQTPAKVEQAYSMIAPETVKSEATSKSSAIGKSAGETASNTNAIPGFKPIEGTKITNESVKIVKDAAPLINTMNKITDEILTDFKNKGYKFTGDDAAKYNANIRYLQMLAKSEPVFNLGVITGPDLMLLDQIIADPSSLKQGMKSTVLGSVEKRLNEFKENVNAGAKEKYMAHGFEKVEQKHKKVYNPQTGKFELR